MAISLLNNIAALEAQNQLQSTQTKLQNTLFQLSSGSRINSGADDAAGLAIANGLQANVTALTQSQQNANTGVGALQVADGALAQVTTLLNRAVTLATESATGTVGSSQRGALQAEYSQIQTEIGNIGTTTSYNGSLVFNNAAANIFLSDGTNSSTIQASQINLDPTQLLKASGQSVTISAGGLPVGGTDNIQIGNTVYSFVAGSNANAAATTTMATADQTGATKETGTSNGTQGKVNVLVDTNSNESVQTQITNTIANLVAAVNGGPGAGTVYQSGGNANLEASGMANGITATFSATVAAASLGASAGNATNATGDVTITPSNANVALIGADTAGTGFLANSNAGTDLSSALSAQNALTAINSAIQTIASDRGNIGAVINRLQAASNVEGVQVQNLTSAEDSIMAANIPQQVTNLSEYSILNQSGISALAQANSAQQSILKLLQ